MRHATLGIESVLLDMTGELWFSSFVLFSSGSGTKQLETGVSEHRTGKGEQGKRMGD